MQLFGLELSASWEQWVVSVVILLAFIAVAFISRLILSGLLLVLARHTKTKLDDLIIRALTVPLFAVLIVTGLWVALARIAELAPHTDIIHKIAVILLIGIGGVAVARVANAFFAWYSVELAPRTETNVDDKLIPLIKRVSTVLIVILTLLIILDQLGINISPILAGLGIGGLAVALSLQPTLSNFLAGTYVISDAVVSVGDYIMLDSGQEGWVEDIGWRSTKRRQWQGNLIVLPNSRLAEATVTDYEKPNTSIQFNVECRVGYDSNLEEVERIATAVAEQVLPQQPEGARDFKPVVHFKQFGAAYINFTIGLKSVTRAGQYVIKHEFIKALHKRFNEEGIKI